MVNECLMVILLGLFFATAPVDKFVDYDVSHEIPLTPMATHDIPYI